MPWNFTYIFQTYIWTIWHTSNVPHPCALTFEYIAEIACKKGHFVSAENFNVWCTQRVGSGHFFQQNFQDVILTPNRAALNTQTWNWGHLKKSRFFHRTPYLQPIIIEKTVKRCEWEPRHWSLSLSSSAILVVLRNWAIKPSSCWAIVQPSSCQAIKPLSCRAQR